MMRSSRAAVMALAVAGAAGALFGGVGAPSSRVEHMATVSGESDRYCGWPTVTSVGSNELVAAFSGNRRGHVCPWGQARIARSHDGGLTWSPSETVANGPLDDRDAGLLKLANGDWVLFWFSSAAFVEDPGCRRVHPEYQEIFDKIDPAVVRRELGAFSIRSADCGKTWEPKVRMPVSTPHGGTQLKDGRILAVGEVSARLRGHLQSDPEEKARPEGTAFELHVAESVDNARSWRDIATIPLAKEHYNTIRVCEPYLVEGEDGVLRCYVRDKNLLYTESRDGGRTWTQTVNTRINAWNSPPHLLRLRDGRVLLSYARRTSAPRNGLTAGVYAVVGDRNGTLESFERGREIGLYHGEPGDFGYASTAENADGTLVTAFYAHPGGSKLAKIMAVRWHLNETDLWGAGFTAFKPGEVTVGGEIGRRMAITADKLLHRIDIENVFFKGFRERKEKPDMWGGFSGWGMALDAIVKAAAHGIGGEEMVRFKERWVAETLATQAADGSISMFSRDPGIWDSHEQAYLIQALCLDHRRFGSRTSLAAARKLADYLIGRQSRVNLGLETAFVMLYEETGDVRYADFCRDQFKIEGDNADYDRALPVNGVVHVYTWIQRALAQLQYAAATGRDSAKMYGASDELFRRTFDNYLSVSGSMSGGPRWGEVWDATQIGLGNWGETCVSAYLLRALAERMKTQPEACFGDLYERVLYNAFFGAQSGDGSKQRYFIPFDEKGEWYVRETYCCPNNLRRMMFELPDAVFFRTGDGFAVNLFAPSALKSDGLAVTVKTDYPSEGKVSVSIRADKAGRMLVRVPGWTGLPDAGSWRAYPYGAGTTDCAFEFPMAIRLVKGRVAQAGKVAVLRGPVVYALEAGKGWQGAIDSYSIDCAKPFAWRDGGVAVTMSVRKVDEPPSTNVVLRPFCSDSRERTYFPTTGPCPAVDDELYRPDGFSSDPSSFKEPVDFGSKTVAKNGFPHESTEWVNMWATDSNATDLPRVLLLGDSICGNYRGKVIEAMKGEAYFASVWGSACVGDSMLTRQLQMMLERYDFDVIHVNNGLHGFGISDARYADELRTYLRLIRTLQPKAKLVWATSTAIGSGSRERSERVVTRNRLAAQVVKELGLTQVDDLYGVVEGHPEYYQQDGVHFADAGQAVLAESVVRSLRAALSK